MAWRSVNNPDGDNGNNSLITIDDWGACCDETAGTIATCLITGHDLTSSPIDRMTIDGTNYQFTTDADSIADLVAGISEAMTAAGYHDVNDLPKGTFVTGDDDDAYIRVVSTASVTKLITTGDSNVTFTCS